MLSFLFAAAGFLLFVGCSKKESPPSSVPISPAPTASAVPSPQPYVPLAAERALLAASTAGEITVDLSKDVKAIYHAQGIAITGFGADIKLALAIKNNSPKTLKLAYPRYLLATDPNYKKGFFNTTEYGPFLFRVPTELPALVESGQTVAKPVVSLWTIGNDADNLDNGGNRSEPWGERRFEVQPLPENFPWTKLADVILAANPPLDPGLAQRIFSIAVSTFSEDRVHALRYINAYAEVPQMEATLRAGDVDPAKIPLFAETHRRYTEQRNKLKTAVNADDLDFSIAMQDFYRSDRLFKGDHNLAAYFAQLLGNSKVQPRNTNYIMALDRLEVTDTVVLDALNACAERDADSTVRQQAAAVASKLTQLRALQEKKP